MPNLCIVLQTPIHAMWSFTCHDGSATEVQVSCWDVCFAKFVLAAITLACTQVHTSTDTIRTHLLEAVSRSQPHNCKRLCFYAFCSSKMGKGTLVSVCVLMRFVQHLWTIKQIGFVLRELVIPSAFLGEFADNCICMQFGWPFRVSVRLVFATQALVGEANHRHLSMHVPYWCYIIAHLDARRTRVQIHDRRPAVDVSYHIVVRNCPEVSNDNLMFELSVCCLIVVT